MANPKHVKLILSTRKALGMMRRQQLDSLQGALDLEAMVEENLDLSGFRMHHANLRFARLKSVNLTGTDL